MSIFPNTDIVSDVARAADPRRVKSAMQRLEKAATAHAAPAPRFEPSLRLAERTDAGHSFLTTSNVPSEYGTGSPGQKFEAFLLQSCLEMLLPKEESGVFGMGGAGSVWRSLIAEHLAAQLASAGGIGVQKLIDQTYSSTSPEA